MTPGAYVSVHGGHSGQFCSHAQDQLSDVVARYAELGFEWVGLTEHLPSEKPAQLPVEEREAGLTAEMTLERFDTYFETARQLQARYRGVMTIAVGFETEAWTGYDTFVAGLITRHQPDYLVGSVHHVHDVCIDASPEDWQHVRALCGGTEALYAAYLDLQFELISRFRPSVIGHFDLIRMFDADYAQTVQMPGVWARVERNLALIATYGGVLDYNVRALAKGQPEPYPCRAIRDRARELDIPLVPGDDSHGVRSVASGLAEGIRRLASEGHDLDWRLPVVTSPDD